jgi:type I restriction enzyme S subunit
MCDMQLPVPSIDKQRGIVKEYDVIQDRIKLNEELIRKLEETAQAIYRQWFVDDVDKENFPEGWRVGKLKDISNQIMGFAFKGDLYNGEIGISVLRGENVSERFLRWDTHKKWNEEIIPRMEKCYLNENDIVIGMDGSKVGKNWALVSKYDLPFASCSARGLFKRKKT